MSAKALNIKRDCPHGGRHKHGTAVAYNSDQCRCPECREADRRASIQRELRAMRGVSNFVPAGPAREHVARLMAAGMSLRRIVDAAGVSDGVTHRLMYGGTNRPGPSQQILRRNANAILSVSYSPPVGRAYVDATGSRRRLQALISIGWSMERLGTALGYANPSQSVWPLIHQPRITVINVQRVSDLYDRLWDKKPPETTPQQRSAATKARRLGARKGWPPPLAWDLETIDDPDATPAGLRPPGRVDNDIDEIAVERRIAGDRVHLTYHETRAAVQQLHARGWNVTTISRRLRISGFSVNQHLDARSAAA